MAAAMHLAGYQHVIATLWYILDNIWCGGRAGTAASLAG